MASQAVPPASASASPSLPSTATFSFKAPLCLAPQPQASGSGTGAGADAGAGAGQTQKARRVSLALPSSPRLVPAWNFRDDTTVAYARKGKVRRIERDYDPADDTADEEDASAPASAAPDKETGKEKEKKARRKWTAEETQMLVDGCNIHGVGNWKTILSDPNLSFANRSPVDLKDRFRTYFPEAYRTHYPNARTHLPPSLARAASPSSSLPTTSSPSASTSALTSALTLAKPNRSTHPDGTPLFPLPSPAHPKRRPFTPEEDQALLQGFRKHGAAWAAIAKDAPVFGVTGRRSMDLRDRFRNAWPGEYERAGYKARPKGKGRKKDTSVNPSTSGNAREEEVKEEEGEEVRGRGRIGRAKTDEGLHRVAGSSVGDGSGAAGGAVRRRRRAHTSQGFKSVSMPPSIVGSDDEGDGGAASDFAFGVERTESFGWGGGVSGGAGKGEETALVGGMRHLDMAPDAHPQQLDSMDMGPDEAMPDAPDPSASLSAPPAAAGPTTVTPSKFQAHRRQEERAGMQMHLSPAGSGAGGGTIGRSAWGTQDWFSPNPRLDSSSASISASTSAAGAFAAGPIPPRTFSPAFGYPGSPPLSSSASFPADAGGGFFELAHGVMERYDLEPAAAHHTHTHLHHHHAHHAGGHGVAQWSSPALSLHSFDADAFSMSNSVSEAGTREWEFDEDSSVAASEPTGWGGGGGGGGGFRGFTHHSNTAGDLIFGARTHQPIWSGVDAWGRRGLAGIAEAHPGKRGEDAVAEGDGDGEGDVGEEGDDKALSLFSLDDLVDLPPDADMGLGLGVGMGGGMAMEDVPMLQPGTPPATRAPPPPRTVHVHHHHHHHHHYAAPGATATTTIARSVSVPPGEGPDDGLPLGLGLMSAPATPALGGARTMALDPALLTAAPPGPLYNLPFLDLHYFGGNSTAGAVPPAGARGGEALDLANARGFSFAQPAPPAPVGVGAGTGAGPPPVVWKALGLPASLRQHIPARPLMRSASGGAVGMGGGNANANGSASASGGTGVGKSPGVGVGAGVGGRSASHQRGQSAVVRPADLLISPDGANGGASAGPKGKRKRASWDGGGW